LNGHITIHTPIESPGLVDLKNVSLIFL
jgi:hypothetical protein